ncbi:S. pombe specific DUF999 protein family 9 [Schizosaccharomyces pombe]|uniref:UPF0494 membrane protein C1348.01 n=2 Tax=Schizosaccharomyces pombe (strain 972 / ATCC 24843) TaxID=284812 RepID=YI41_SCHPO|nr:uncharacterized protein SPBCPT2R1.01c [Schizosaccharomyces pombe]NP_592763.1 uncharacterized protein SPBC1348.01 [Schizosaccharomyces pombe]P0CS86.1 RecName: Full=UPF0494 membrane protein C1348.01 [Schizosaccharomyces pombe 972h-]P0CS87.1 RecName: Full=UPF0494 membrane protein CPT2R1.01c [Schizosaccharomyces pombe 972h-]CAB94268.1 S. pombe specific DUF999 protein family 5 [Schizosaccharomyces pombe]CAE54416.1 SPBCPT2R1.01c [Schizosaccharomyces pombe]CAO77670.1 S. pombe specific DUF999 prot|eukprot:NP_001343047.1 uncharacterized protein SPBCPT2R1.01c [Schizosaccharomyces pombe]
MSNPESLKKQVEPPGYNELFMVEDVCNVDLEQGLDLCKPEKVNKQSQRSRQSRQSLFTNTIKPQKDKMNIKTNKIKEFLNDLFTEFSKFHNSYYPDGRISTRSNFRWPLLIIWSIIIVFAVDKKFEVQKFLSIWINENRFYSEIWVPIAIYVCLLVLMLLSLIFFAEFAVLALRVTGVIIAVLGMIIAVLGMIIAALGATITGLLYFGHWALYKLVILSLGFKIVTPGDVCVSNTLPTHNGETALHSETTVGSDIEQIELQNMPTPVKK